MKSFSPALTTSYASGTTTFATCWKATLANGTVVTATSLDRDIVFGGLTYKSAQSYSASNIESSSELNPDNLEVEGFLAFPAITDEDIHSGLWDYAEIEVFEVDYNKLSAGRNGLRFGRLGEVRGGRSKFTAEFRGLLQAYTRTIVRLVTKECTADLGDVRCKVDLAAITVTGSVWTSAGNILVVDKTRTEPDDWFVGGKLTWTSGANSGRSMEVKRSKYNELELTHAMYEPIMQGDTYMVYAGCTKRFDEDCVAKHNNVLNFRGFPDLPGSKIYRQGGVHYDDGASGGSTGGSSGGGSGVDGGGSTTFGMASGLIQSNGVETSFVGKAGSSTGLPTGYYAMDLVGGGVAVVEGTYTVSGLLISGASSSIVSSTGTLRMPTAPELAAYLSARRDYRYTSHTTTMPPVLVDDTPTLYTETKNGINFNVDFRLNQGYVTSDSRLMNWTPSTVPNTSQWAEVAWSPELGLAVFASEISGMAGGDFLVSSDGVNWESVKFGPLYGGWATAFMWNSQSQKFLYYTRPTFPGGTYFQGLYVPYNTMYSEDGYTWQELIGAPDVLWVSMQEIPSKSLTVGVTGDAKAGISHDGGLTWSFYPLPISGAEAIGGVRFAYSSTLDKFVAVTDSVYGDSVMTSSDFINWTKQSSPAGQWGRISWVPEVGKFFICGQSASSQQPSRMISPFAMMSSPDGVNWTPVTNIFFPVWLGSVYWDATSSKLKVNGVLDLLQVDQAKVSFSSSDGGVTWGEMQPAPHTGRWIPDLGKIVWWDGWSDGSYGPLTTYYWPYDQWKFTYTPA